jgi:5'-nucleotidase
MGKPAIAVSLVTDGPPYYYDPVCQFVTRNLDSLLAMWHPDTLLNINAPNSADGWSGIEVTYPARRMYHDKLESFDAPDGTKYCFFSDGWVESIPAVGSDYAAVKAGKLSISLVYLHPVEHQNDRIDTSIFR